MKKTGRSLPTEVLVEMQKGKNEEKVAKIRNTNRIIIVVLIILFGPGDGGDFIKEFITTKKKPAQETNPVPETKPVKEKKDSSWLTQLGPNTYIINK